MGREERRTRLHKITYGGAVFLKDVRSHKILEERYMAVVGTEGGGDKGVGRSRRKI